MRTVITFLGTAILPTPTVYRLGGIEYTGHVFAEALCQFTDFDRMLVCATVEARDTTWPLLSALGDSRIERLDIETGGDAAELWRIFEVLTGSVDQGDTLIFDITHGLRSLPFLVFLVAAYLQAARDVTIEAIYYGAYELGQPAPIIDLSEFVSLLDWLSAADRFTQTGEGRPLADLLRKRMPPGLAMRDDLESRALGKSLRNAAAAIEDVSLALRVTRPLETMESAARLGSALQQARDAIATRARPFALLAEQVHDAYAPFALADPLHPTQWAANLNLQLAMVRWYLDNQQVVQAATLAREWLVSLVTLRVGAASLVDLNGERVPVEGALNNLCRRQAHRVVDRPSPRDADVARLPGQETLASVWNKMRDIRNDIAHVGMNEDPKPAAVLCDQMAAIYPKLEELAQALLEKDSPAENDHDSA